VQVDNKFPTGFQPLPHGDSLTFTVYPDIISKIVTANALEWWLPVIPGKKEP